MKHIESLDGPQWLHMFQLNQELSEKPPENMPLPIVNLLLHQLL
ncbi:MAG: hypothetical protein WCK53_08225 [Methanomicrobiales archaeon]